MHGKLADIEIEWSDEAAVCVVLASGGYPGPYAKGVVIEGLDQIEDAVVFHAGTARNEAGDWVTNGGRILGVVGLGADIAEARTKAYAQAELIQFEGKHQRTDIAAKALV